MTLDLLAQQAAAADAADPLAEFRNEFRFPQHAGRDQH
jgi:hypothetical protein